MKPPVTRRRPRSAGDERGLALIYLALVLTILMIMAALVVDIGNARQQKTSAQNAVDGAALSAAQVLMTTKSSQPQNVFDLAANTAYNALSLHHPVSAAGTCAAAGSSAVPPAVCQDYQYTSSGILYDVQVTTPFIGPGEVVPDTSMLNVKSCWSVPTVFGRVIGQNSIPICAVATAQNGVGTGGPSNGGCGTATELTTITDTLTTKPAGQQTITAVYDTSTSSNRFPLETTSIHFVVQTQYGTFMKIPMGLNGVGQPGVSYSMTPPTGGTTVTISYTLPTSIDTSGGAAYSNTFSANLQVIDTAGRHCGNASWSTCGLKRGVPHDPIFDGGTTGDVGSSGWGVDATNGLRAHPDDVVESGGGDGKDLNTTTDLDDTVWPLQGSLITAGTPIGAIYQDEWPLRAASVSLVIDGNPVGYGGSAWGSNTYTFVDPSTVTLAAPTAIAGMPAFGTVDNAVSRATYNGGGLRITLYDTMKNPMPGETVSVSTIPGSQISRLNGIADFTWPAADGTYTVTYSGARGNGTFKVTTSGTSVSSQTPANIPFTGWPSGYNTKGNDGSLPYWGESVGVMDNSTGLTPGWHSAVLFANDGDVTAQGGDCGIVAWAFSSTGGVSGPSTLHLIT